MAALADLRTLAGDLDHPEGVTTGPNGLLYAGGEAGQVYQIDPDGRGSEQIADTGGFVLGLCLDAAGTIYACDAARASVVRIDAGSGRVDTFCDGASGLPLICPNWPAFAADGTLWLSDSGTEPLDARDGRLIRIPPEGDAEVLDIPPLHFPNGLAVSARGAVYVLESYTPRLSILRDSGLETVADLPGVLPDGVAIDGEGGFFVACYYPFRVLRVPPGGGDPEVVLDDLTGTQIPMPTNVSFFGPELRSLAIANYGGYAIKAIDVPIAGAPLLYPDLS
jgi:sugar lactone lactonase YvrE